MKTVKQLVEELVSFAGIVINGSNPWDIRVKDERFYGRVMRDGSLGLGESYMDGWWESDQLDETICKILSAKLDKKVRGNLGFVFQLAVSKLMNRQKISRAYIIGEKHYDAGNDLYQAMLDKRMVYTCGYWKAGNNLDEAQEAKLDLVCRKIGLKAGQKVLDIGCGWGSFAKFAAEKYGASVVGITVSKEQAELARQMCQGLPVEIRLQDYRLVNEKFDHIVSLGMFEHVGYKNYRVYMEVAERCLKDDGFFLLHTIGGNKSAITTNPWIEKYIFPNSMLPSIAQIGKSIENIFVMEDWHNFGPDYEKTLLAWFNNFNSQWSGLKNRYNETFYRMWKFYLLSCAGLFRARSAQLWQIVLSKGQVRSHYDSIR